MTEGAQKRLGFSAIGGRKAKAEKIVAILAAAGRPLKPGDRVLDLGCGSGEIAAFLADLAQVSCADAADQRITGLELPFHRIVGKLAYGNGNFDVVISNHVIEHTADPALHLGEMRRLLKPGGVAYLATPNRWWPWEFHAKLPLLHFLPWWMFSRIAIRSGRLHEPVRLLSLRQLRRLCADQFQIDVWHHRIISNPSRFGLSLPTVVRHLLSLLPGAIFHLTAAAHPTLILILRPE